MSVSPCSLYVRAFVSLCGGHDVRSCQRIDRVSLRAIRPFGVDRLRLDSYPDMCMSDVGNWDLPEEEIPMCDNGNDEAMCEHDHMVSIMVNGTLYAYGDMESWLELSKMFVQLERGAARPIVFQDGDNRWEKYPGQMRKHCLVYP